MKKLLLLPLLLATSLTLADTVFVDVRTDEEFQQDHLESAAHIPFQQIAAEIGKLNLAKDDEVVLYCRSGRRADIAAETLAGMGFTHVKNVKTLDGARSYQSTLTANP
jgi:phage shock protein E